MRKIQSILFLKCPRCREGSLLVGHPYKLRNLNKVNESCAACQLNFKIETGFFYGSMYVSYGLGVGISIALYIIQLLMGLDLGMIPVFILITTSLILLMPYINALSKIIWANFFFRYDPSFKSKKNKID